MFTELDASLAGTVPLRRPRKPANRFLSTLKLEVAEAFRARWFLLYTLVFFGLVAVMLTMGLTQSRIMGFTGLTRILVTYTQFAMAIVPVFVLISTVRSLAGDREAGVFEYMLALPIGIGAWYAGRLFGRFLVSALPVLAALAIAVGYSAALGVEIPWRELGLEIGFLVTLIWCFIGLAFMISAVSRSTDTAQTAAFVTWLAMVLLLDLVFLGLLIRADAPLEVIVGAALANPLQVFRTASMLIFDPQLVLLGPTAYVIFDLFGRVGFLAWAFAYPVLFGATAAGIGYAVFRRSDLP